MIRGIWTVAAGRITFAYCAFSIFEIHENSQRVDQNPPARKYAMFPMVNGVPFGSKSVQSQKTVSRLKSRQFSPKKALLFRFPLTPVLIRTIKQFYVAQIELARGRPPPRAARGIDHTRATASARVPTWGIERD